jgi:probable metal-binding protein
MSGFDFQPFGASVDSSDMKTTTTVHGHDVLYMVYAANPPFTRKTLAEHVERTYGAEARFCTCSQAELTFDQLLEFLIGRGKIVESKGELFTVMEKVCKGGEHGHEHDH